MKKKTNKSLANNTTGLFNLGSTPLSIETIEAELPKVQKALSALPESKEKVTISHAFANFYGFVKGGEWLRGIGASVNA